ncbi:MAG: 3-deoxy-7-phosphoheptulonate synthase [Candidatus Marinimicrobia bacterium]|jgi:3-deoxy-7-phosphoheptulonate synthase|nr:3-deoxy-7-phosphoheptulonate synthase [Candidatus Neomarinimicrobiota bacterium]MBT4715966.1 3-deoxy-7-phosphoheptulonate synthase [Candidatus Neomarinimicrobiota bacterium]MBT4948101.1 3-deoxy-7-phosphoheptulonate synthase [Candidatus Neomarinimicrobiota bacterium]MBT5270983.1 3-deoxy-7-phosphoheptulonate synthase [Candidatus Neomarinimicrobiota bacterium]MBT6012495.1 3-deoxy-7-phosphoheptulonate synthase [Candidatus Neomarinimicrobiota bacterium]
MIVIMNVNASPEAIDRVQQEITKLGYTPKPAPGETRTIVGVMGTKPLRGKQHLQALPEVSNVIEISTPYKLASREWQPQDTIVNVGGARIGGSGVSIIAGPCSIESYEQTKTVGDAVKAAGGHFLRGGAFKPRTSPYSFQGLGVEGLKILKQVGKEVGLPTVTEVTDTEVLEITAQHTDMLQIGTRNMQNFTLIKAAARTGLPIFLKRGMSATVKETILAAEYILNEGNEKLVLCERGIRTYVDHTRNTLDVSAIPAFQRLTHLPVVVDPSHAAGKRSKVLPLSLAGVAAGAQGVMVEVHPNPEVALSDGPQQLVPADFKDLVDRIRLVAEAVGRKLD